MQLALNRDILATVYGILAPNITSSWVLKWVKITAQPVLMRLGPQIRVEKLCWLQKSYYTNPAKLCPNGLFL